LSVCVCVYLRVALLGICSVVDFLSFLSLVCLNGECGLQETHAGLLQPVSDSSTVAHFLWLCVVISGF